LYERSAITDAAPTTLEAGDMTRRTKVAVLETNTFPRQRPVVLTLLASLMAVVVCFALAPSNAASASAAGSTPPRAYFGMHYNQIADGVSWPDAPVGHVRLWDTGTMWPQIQPARGSWDFSRLDKAVANARRHGARISLVLGQSPAWASSRPTESAFYGAGYAAPPKLASDWWNYVHTVAARYRGRIVSYEIWNEVNLRLFYSGSVAEMVRLTRIGRDAIKRADPEALVIAPSVTLRSKATYLGAFARAGGYRYADVVNVHGYPLPAVGPEAGVAMVVRARRGISTYAGGRKPLWNTEMNYGLAVPTAFPLSSRRQAAYITRAYLLNFSAGVKRLVWYNWSAEPFLGVRVASGGTTAAGPGRAFRTVREWMRGHVYPCTVDGRGLYSCTVQYSAHRWAAIRWIPSGVRTTVAPKGTYVRRDVLGLATPTSSRARVTIGFSPVLFEYRR
jgi:hypothetical protein